MGIKPNVCDPELLTLLPSPAPCTAFLVWVNGTFTFVQVPNLKIMLSSSSSSSFFCMSLSNSWTKSVGSIFKIYPTSNNYLHVYFYRPGPRYLHFSSRLLQWPPDWSPCYYSSSSKLQVGTFKMQVSWCHSLTQVPAMVPISLKVKTKILRQSTITFPLTNVLTSPLLLPFCPPHPNYTGFFALHWSGPLLPLSSLCWVLFPQVYT